MTGLTAYQLNTQYQKTELKYEAKITPASSEEFKIEKKKNDDEIENSVVNAPIVYTSESDLSSIEQIRKMIMEQVLGGFNPNRTPESLFPNENMDVSNESYLNGNPYAKDLNNMPSGLMYSSNYEYYEKTTIEFSAQARIKTPNGEYNIELKFSYTQEFYEKNETSIAIANEQFKNPFDIELDKDNEKLKDLKSLHFIFDVFDNEKEEKVDVFEEIRELLKQRREAMLEMFKEDKEDKVNQNTSTLNNFQVWQETSSSEFNLIAAKKDGVGIFLANASSQSSSIGLNVTHNGYSLQASYSNSEVNYARIESDLKA